MAPSASGKKGGKEPQKELADTTASDRLKASERLVANLPARAIPRDSEKKPYIRWKENQVKKDAWKRLKESREAETREFVKDGVGEVPVESGQPGVGLVFTTKLHAYRICTESTEDMPMKMQTFGGGYQEESGLYDLEDEADAVQQDPMTGHYFLPMPEAGPQYYKFIIGSRGAVRDEIERDTGATISIPRQGESGQDKILTIRALAASACVAAKQRIDIVLESSRYKVSYTHFISIPLRSAVEQTKKLLQKMDTQFSGKSKGVDHSIFQIPSRMHLTLLMLRLYSPQEIEKAQALLRKVGAYIDDNFDEADKLHLKGLNYMNDDPKEVHVLYLQVAQNETAKKMTKLIDYVSSVFIEAGLATEKEIQHNEKMHATVMNSKWRAAAEELEEEEDPDQPEREVQGGERVPFDIRGIMDAFGKEDLGTHPLSTLELSNFTTMGPNKYWKSEQSIPFPY